MFAVKAFTVPLCKDDHLISAIESIGKAIAWHIVRFYGNNSSAEVQKLISIDRDLSEKECHAYDHIFLQMKLKFYRNRLRNILLGNCLCLCLSMHYQSRKEKNFRIMPISLSSESQQEH